MPSIRGEGVKVDTRWEPALSLSDVAPSDTPRRAMSLLDRRVTLTTVALLLGLAAAAWYLTVRQAMAMGDMVTGLGQVGTRMPNDMTVPLFEGMWLTMMVAMMFPTIAPMLLAHGMVTRKQGQGYLPTAAFVAGYLAIWTLMGLVPLTAFLAFRNLSVDAGGTIWLRAVAGSVLVVAGLYQFTGWKRTCLKACRTPLSFIMTHDFGAGASGAFRAGMSHGAYCLGCCWALMSVLVIVGLMNLLWMVALALIFLAEKNWRHGAALIRVVGPALVLLGAAVILVPGLLVWVSGGSPAAAPSGHM